MEAVKVAQEIAADQESAPDRKDANKKKGEKGAARPQPNGIRDLLTQSVMESIFAEAYNLHNFVKPAADWALAPMNLKNVYDGMVFPYYREHENSALPGAWDEFIASESAVQRASRDESGFLEWSLVQGKHIQWRKHLDLLKSGIGGKASGDELIRLVSENPTHPNLGDWMKDLDEVWKTITGERPPAAPVDFPPLEEP